MEYRTISADDLPKVYDIELACFPAEEAETFDAIQQRQKSAPDLFMGAYDAGTGTLAGFMCASRFDSTPLTKATMSTHSPTGPYAAIHSVCVAPDHRGQGLATSMLKEYLAWLRRVPGIIAAHLITHQHLQSMYERAGFTLVGESSVVHGPDTWWEMKQDLAAPTLGDSDIVDDDPVDMRNPGKLVTFFASGLDDLVDKETGLGKADLFCPRPECRCILLKAGVGKLVRALHSDFELPPLPRPKASPLPARTAASSAFWSVPSPLSFENIGFSRNAAPPSAAATNSPKEGPSPPANIKYLTCADCDHGPLGWHDTEGRDLGLEVEDENEGKVAGVRKGREFLLAADRVRYRVN